MQKSKPPQYLGIKKTLLIFLISTCCFFKQEKAQTSPPRQFSFCNQTNDSIQVSDLENCTELVASDKNLRIKSFVVVLRLGEEFQEFEPNKGGSLVPGITGEIVKQRRKLKYIEIKDIVALEGKNKKEKKFKDFRVYVKQSM